MPSKAKTPQQYLAELPDDRREALEAIIEVINKNIDKTFELGMQYGCIGYYVPHKVFPAGYHCNPKEPLPFAGFASQKHHIGLYLFCIYMNPKLKEWFAGEWKKSGKKLDMGKACVRVKNLDGVPLDVLGKLFKKIKAKDFIRSYEESLSQSSSRKTTAKKKGPGKKAAKKKTAKKKSASRKSAS